MQSTEIARRLQRWTAISSLALIAVTWRLWTPQTVYPQVPVFEMLCRAPAWLDWICLIGLAMGLTLLAIAQDWRRAQIACVAIALALLISIGLDQHRFQPWAYELGLFCSVWMCAGSDARLRLLRWLLISLYCYSAISKLDFEFLHTVGQQMLAVITTTLGLDVQRLPQPARIALVSLFPLAELAIGIALAWPRTRRVAGWFAIGMHLGLIVILGPLGLNHRLGVLVWNAQVALQVYWLFATQQTESSEREPGAASLPNSSRTVEGVLRWPPWISTAIIVAAIILPCTERLGVWDHWPSWALYAPHSSRVYVEVAAPAVKRLPEELQALIQQPAAEDDAIAVWVVVPIDAWSLRSLDTPIYPQARFQLGVAEKIASEVASNFQVRVTALGTASRFTGSRRAATYEGQSQLKNASKQFWLNSHPRRHPSPQ